MGKHSIGSMMKTSELKKIIEAKGYRLHEGYASVSIKDKMVTIANITKSGSTFSMLDGIGFEVDLFEIANRCSVIGNIHDID